MVARRRRLEFVTRHTSGEVTRWGFGENAAALFSLGD
jgi:hypothetical protein